MPSKDTSRDFDSDMDVALKTSEPIKGEYRHSNGYLCCGTLRIARADFDTNPPQAMRDATLDWLAQLANEAQHGR